MSEELKPCPFCGEKQCLQLAYDPELVAQQLEAYSDVGEAEQLGTIPIVELADAIKIVKGGGVGND